MADRPLCTRCGSPPATGLRPSRGRHRRGQPGAATLREQGLWWADRRRVARVLAVRGRGCGRVAPRGGGGSEVRIRRGFTPRGSSASLCARWVTWKARSPSEAGKKAPISQVRNAFPPLRGRVTSHKRSHKRALRCPRGRFGGASLASARARARSPRYGTRSAHHSFLQCPRLPFLTVLHLRAHHPSTD